MPKHILVTGDFIVDHHIYEGSRHAFGDPAESGVRLEAQLGGAALVHKLLTALYERKDKAVPKSSDKRLLPADWVSVVSVVDPTNSARANGTYLGSDQAYAFWRPTPAGRPREQQVWRATEAMGFGAVPRAGSGASSRPASGRVPSRTVWAPAPDIPETPEIVVVADGGAELSKSGLQWSMDRFNGSRWVVLKVTSAQSGTQTWERLAHLRDRLIVVVSARDLRALPVRLSSRLSWEASVQDLLASLVPTGRLASLVACRHLIVSFGTEGAVCLDFGASATPNALAGARVQLLYAAGSIEGDHAAGLGGDAYGLQSCLAAALVVEVARHTEAPDITRAVEGGLCGMRDLRDRGHGPASEQPAGFPAERLAKAIATRPYLYSRATFLASEAMASGWSILQQSERSKAPAYNLARLVLLRGNLALANVPHVQLGHFLTPDRSETETVRGLRQLVQDYKQRKKASKPLSIGVFGPPGAGKSFAVRQMANIVPGSKWLEFNLSQFNDPSELIAAFHQIQDEVLDAQLPIAFFDEFDSQNYLWLKHLLAPMQDGRFQHGQLVHPIGKCVLAFAGGTSWTYGTFGPPEPGADGRESDAYREFRLAKGPDFKSRLDGYLDVVGPNQRQVPVSETAKSNTAMPVGGRWFDVDAADIHFPIRRALMIRSELKCAVDEKLDVDEGLVTALLHVDRYTHGSRSLGKVVQPFGAARPAPLRRSMLPPWSQLNLHVAADAFLRLCDEPPPPRPPVQRLGTNAIEVMAGAIHEFYRKLAKAEGWSKAATDRDFIDLEEFFKNSNRAAADRFFAILGLAGLALADGHASKDEELAVRTHLEYRLEVLAEAEHDGWMDWHLSQGWRYAPKRNDDRQEHNCLRPYLQLPLVETNKDRDAIRHYPEVAAEAGLKIVFV